MIDSLTALLTGVVDYAGLFPPAKLDMAPAVRAYADYLADPNRFMLGRFVVPVARLPEFEQAANELLPRDGAGEPWRLTALTGPDIEADLDLAGQFNDRHASGTDRGRAVIDALEIKASAIAEIASAMSRMTGEFRPYFELPSDADPEPLIAELRRTKGLAKIRTGGITADAFPPASDIARFMVRCHEHGVAFKATAGLHHPIRAEYRLTYEPEPPVGTMYGYLNVFLAAAFARTGADVEFVEEVLKERDIIAFTFGNAGITYRDRTLATETIRTTRDTFAISFGSCSFREPVDDLAALHLL